jgi:hypothetical protein
MRDHRVGKRIEMTKPQRFVFRMLIFLVGVCAVGYFLFPELKSAFLANAPLNGLIGGVLVLGIIYNFRQVITLSPAISWLEAFRGERGNHSPDDTPPSLLAPMAQMLGERRERLQLSTMSMRSILDGIASRLEESRDLSRYIIGLLVFLGLLGTFWGLLITIGAVGDVIGGLSVDDGGDLASMFAELKRGLEVPLDGMGTAFSSSLFGLGGSLVLGFLDLQAGQAQNRFYTDLEDWLSGVTRLSTGAGPADGEQSVPAYVQSLLEQTAEGLEGLQRTLARGEESRLQANNQLMALGEKIGTLTDQMRAEQELMLRLAGQQNELKPILIKLSEAFGEGAPSAGMDDVTRGHIRNLDLYVSRLIEELIAGREEVVRQIRSDIKLLARTIAASAETPDR